MSGELPFYKRLGFRVGLLLFISLMLVDTLTIPLWDWLFYKLTPEWYEPDYLRATADYLESVDPKEIEISTFSQLEGRDRLIVVAAIGGYVLSFSLLITLLVGRMTTSRISRLTRQAATPIDGEERLPGPFKVHGKDEIQHLAETMNRMRGRTLDLLHRLRDRDVERRRWVTEVSHDLRTPVTALGISLERSQSLLERLPPSEERIELERQLEVAQLDANRVIELAEDLLEVARLDAGDELVCEPVPPGELLRNAVDELKPLAESREVRLELEFPAGLPELQADGRRLIRALENLVVNSIRHASSEVRVSAETDGGSLRIRVEDDGPGFRSSGGSEIGAEPLGLEDLESSRPESTGIGLQVTDRIIAAHRGTLTVANRADGGAQVTVRLPLGAPEPELETST